MAFVGSAAAAEHVDLAIAVRFPLDKPNPAQDLAVLQGVATVEFVALVQFIVALARAVPWSRQFWAPNFNLSTQGFRSPLNCLILDTQGSSKSKI